MSLSSCFDNDPKGMRDFLDEMIPDADSDFLDALVSRWQDDIARRGDVVDIVCILNPIQGKLVTCAYTACKEILEDSSAEYKINLKFNDPLPDVATIEIVTDMLDGTGNVFGDILKSAADFEMEAIGGNIYIRLYYPKTHEVYVKYEND